MPRQTTKLRESCFFLGNWNEELGMTSNLCVALPIIYLSAK